MSECLHTDALVAVGAALDWNVGEGLQHVQRCTECRMQVELLQLTHASFSAVEPVDPDVLRGITTALASARLGETARAQARARWAWPFEGVAAGLAALLVLVSSDVRVDSPGAAALAFLLGATLMTVGSIVTRKLPVFSSGADDAGMV
jgi:hypothetical protein